MIPDPFTAQPLVENLKTTRIVTREIGQHTFIMGRADQGPFSLASMLLGIEAFLFALSDPTQKDKLHRLLEFSLEVVYRYALAQMEQGAHITSIGESLSGPDVCSPKMYKEFAWGYDKRLAEKLQAKNIRLAYHICGNATRIINEMVDSGSAILELDYKCDLPKIKAATLGKTTILGVIDPSAVLERGSVDDVTDKVREELAVLAPGGGLILSPGCALAPHTPPANIHALIETTRRFGRYDSAGNLLN